MRVVRFECYVMCRVDGQTNRNDLYTHGYHLRSMRFDFDVILAVYSETTRLMNVQPTWSGVLFVHCMLCGVAILA